MTNTSKFWVGVMIVVGAAGIGVAIANQYRVDVTPAVPIAAAEPAALPPAPVRHALPMPKRTTEPAPALVMSTDLANVAKPLLQPGTDLAMASEGFSSRESFLATAYAAKNLSIPFVLLKDRVIAGRMSLEMAIHEIKPDADAKRETARAIAEGRSEIMRPSGS